MRKRGLEGNSGTNAAALLPAIPAAPGTKDPLARPKQTQSPPPTAVASTASVPASAGGNNVSNGRKVAKSKSSGTPGQTISKISC